MSPWIESVVLPVLKELCTVKTSVTSSLLADHIGRSRRAAYGYLRQMEVAQLVVRPSPRRWRLA
jgi:DNA-binding IclR family transcriptional regulator